MEHINNLIGNQTGKQLVEASTTTQAQSTFSAEEKDLAAWFFMRMGNIYLRKFTSAFPDEESLKFAKREYTQSITAFNREQLNAIFVKLKEYIALGHQDYVWPNINLILAITPRVYESVSHRPFESGLAIEDLTAKAARKAKGREMMRKLRADCGI